MNAINLNQTEENALLRRMTQVIQRGDLDCLTTMNVEGTETFLGEVRHFKSNNFLDLNMPKDLSIAWTQMPAGKELPAHYHPCPSLLIVTNGEGRSTGDTEIDVKAGDIIYIPEWNLHGFKGKGKEGFRALSIQFQSDAIFSSEDKPETSYFDREQIPLEQRQLIKISRDSMETITEVIVDGVKENLGVLKNFASIDVLKTRLPRYFSAAWVHLENDERLNNHQHTTDSMIIVTEGNGFATGDKESHLNAGDIVYIPAGNTHGFKGSGNDGFWALSIQFDETSLYEDIEKPRVSFIKEQTPFEKLISLNEKCVKEFKKNEIFSEELRALMSNKESVIDLKNCLQVMSNSFQRLMFSRMALSKNEKYRKIFFEHLIEELGHDTELKSERGEASDLWDPILEASTFWFFGKNFLIDDPERIVMIQMVLEKGASLFYGHFAEVLKDSFKSDHIEKHCDLDEGHDSLGVDLLELESAHKLLDLQGLLEESWSMLGLFLGRTAEIIKSNQKLH